MINHEQHNSSTERPASGDAHSQFASFYLGDRLFGVNVRGLREVVKPMTVTRVPLAAPFIRGLANLRGRLVTVVTLQELFGIATSTGRDPMHVVCDVGGLSFAFLADEIGDIVEVSDVDVNPLPGNIDERLTQYMSGVYRLGDDFLTLIDLESIASCLKGQDAINAK